MTVMVQSLVADSQGGRLGPGAVTEISLISDLKAQGRQKELYGNVSLLKPQSPPQ